MEVLAYILPYLVGAVILVPIANRIGLGSVLGYLIAGVALGPALGLVTEHAVDLQHFSEFGVVMMLFLIGLELRPGELWKMRAQLLGLGGLQVFGTMALIVGGVWVLMGSLSIGLVLGMVLALSSTAIVLQTLQERNLERHTGGRAAFAVLLFQDIAVIPMLALLPLLAQVHESDEIYDPADDVTEAAGHHATNLLDGLPAWAQALGILGVIVAIIIAGRFLAYPVFRFIASGRSGEVFTAAALALVIGTSMLMTLVGLSPALGAFLAGVVLSGSEYRHQLESDIEPFKGLLLGIFFVTVGAGVDFGLLLSQPFFILGAAFLVIAIKAFVLAVLAIGSRFAARDAWLFSLALPQGGEFGFVLLALAVSTGALPGDIAQMTTLVIALTMFLTPILFTLYAKVIEPRLGVSKAVTQEADTIDHEGMVIIAGVGRFGQIVNRLLRSDGVETVVLDEDARQIDTLRRFGVRAYYGDASRMSLLEAAGIDHARVFVAALRDTTQQVRLVEDVRRRWPHVHVIARATDRTSAYRLSAAGAQTVVREILAGSIEAGREALEQLGTHPYRAEGIARAFRKHDDETFAVLRDVWTEDHLNDTDYVTKTRERSEELSDILRSDFSHTPESDEWALHAAERFDREEGDEGEQRKPAAE